MPHLESAIRKHPIGSDDLTVPATVEIVTYVVWLVLYIRHPYMNTTCLGDYVMLQSFNSFGVILMVSGVVMSLMILCTSLKGTTINTFPRQNMGKLVVLKLILDMLTILVILTATMEALLGDLTNCHPDTLGSMHLRIGLSWLVAVVLGINIWHWTLPPLRIFDWLRLDILSAEKKQSLWRFFGFDDHSMLNGVVDLLLKFFKERTDVVPTDLLVSLILLEKDQRSKFLPTFSPPGSTASSKAVASSSPEPWMKIRPARHYLRLATGTFGWLIFTLCEPLNALKLFVLALKKGVYYFFCGFPSKLRKDRIVGDNFCMTKTIAIQLLTRLSTEEIVYASFENRLFEVPFFVAIDRSEKSIVVSVRGSYSISDVMTDLTAQESEIFASKDLSGICAHTGMLTAAKKLEQKLLGIDENGRTIQEGLLLKAKKQLEDLVGPDSAKEYKLVLTGHSLGAGVASVLSILLYQRAEYKTLQCFAFSPPGGLLNLSAAIYSEPFIFCIVLGDDVVARLGVYTVFDLKLKVLQTLKECDIPKHTIVGGWLQEKLIGLLGRSQSVARIDHKALGTPSWADDEEASRTVTRYQRHLQNVIDSTLVERDSHSRLYLPGRILHICESSGTSSLSNVGQPYMTRWCERNADIFNEVILSPNLVYHHRPDIVRRAFNAMSDSEKI